MIGRLLDVLNDYGFVVGVFVSFGVGYLIGWYLDRPKSLKKRK